MFFSDRSKAAAISLFVAGIAVLLFGRTIALAATALTSQFYWLPIGPNPAVLNEIPDFASYLVPVPSGALLTASGRVTAVAMDTNQSGRLFLGSANGSLWLSTDGGGTFTDIGSGLPQTSAIGSVALDETTGGFPNLYVGTGEGNHCFDCYHGKGIFESTSHGQSWTQIGSAFNNNSIANLVLDTSNSSLYRLYAAVGDAFSASRSGADQLIGSPANYGIWKATSTNKGASWSSWSHVTVPSPFWNTPSAEPGDNVAIDPHSPSHVYATLYQEDLFVSSDYGLTWSAAQFSSGFPNQNRMVGRISIGVSPSTAGVVYALVGGPDLHTFYGFYKSTNYGWNWTAETLPNKTLPNGATIDGPAGTTGQSFYDSVLAVSPTSSSTVFLGGIGIYESTDSGGSWTAIFDNPPSSPATSTHADQHALAFDPFNSNSLFVGNDGGLYLFNLSTSAFSSKNDVSLSTGQLYTVGTTYATPSNVIGGFQDNGTTFYPAPGWSSTDPGDASFTRVDPNDQNYVYHVYGVNSAAVARSTDGGHTWSKTNVPLAANDHPGFYPALAVSPLTRYVVYFAAHFLYQSTDAGTTWLQLATQDLTGGCSDGSCAVSDIAITQLPGNDGLYRLFTLSRAGGTVSSTIWSFTSASPDSFCCYPVAGTIPAQIPVGTQLTSLAVSPVDASVFLTVSGFSGGAYHHIYHSQYGTGSWSYADGVGGTAPLPDVPVTGLLVDGSDSTGKSLLAGTDTGVYASTDGGSTWSNFSHGVVPSVPVFDVAQNAQYQIAIATHGRGAYRLPPPVVLRGFGPPNGEGCESGGCTVWLNCPSGTKYGDTVLAFIWVGGCHPNSDLVLPFFWSILRGQCVTSGRYSVTFWTLKRSITPQNPVPSGGYDSFSILSASLDEGAGEMVAYSGTSTSNLLENCTPYAGSYTSFTAPGAQSGHDSVALQWFQDAPLATTAPNGMSAEDYDDTYGLWIDWTPPSDPYLSVILDTWPSDIELFTQRPLPTTGSYGPWTATAYSHAESGWPAPPAANGLGLPCTVVLQPNG